MKIQAYILALLVMVSSFFDVAGASFWPFKRATHQALAIDLTDDDPEKCAVCIEALLVQPVRPLRRFSCGHEFHYACAVNCLQNGVWKCPKCRKLDHAARKPLGLVVAAQQRDMLLVCNGLRDGALLREIHEALEAALDASAEINEQLESGSSCDDDKVLLFRLGQLEEIVIVLCAALPIIDMPDPGEPQVGQRGRLREFFAWLGGLAHRIF